MRRVSGRRRHHLVEARLDRRGPVLPARNDDFGAAGIDVVGRQRIGAPGPGPHFISDSQRNAYMANGFVQVDA